MISYFLNLPKDTIVDKKIDKKQFFERGNLSSSDKKQFTSDVEKVIWLNRIAQDTVNIRPLCDDVRDYTEIQVIEVALRKDAHIQKIADAVLSSLPYPIIAIFSMRGKIKIIAAHKRINQNDKSKLVTEEQVRTKWLGEVSGAAEIMDMSKMSTANMFELYSDVMDSMQQFRLITEAGKDIGVSAEESKMILADVERIDREISSLRSKLKEEDHFNRMVELKEKIRKLRKERSEILSVNSRPDPDDDVNIRD